MTYSLQSQSETAVAEGSLFDFANFDEGVFDGSGNTTRTYQNQNQTLYDFQNENS